MISTKHLIFILGVLYYAECKENEKEEILQRDERAAFSTDVSLCESMSCRSVFLYLPIVSSYVLYRLHDLPYCP